MPAAAQLLLSALSKQVPGPAPLISASPATVCSGPLTSEAPLADAIPLTSEPPLADATPLTSEPPLAVLAPLTSEPASSGSARGMESPGV
ncbi:MULTISPECIES: hypothetical protein [unclassified Streptomyces]|uniref:hypothetical protein n=1 Tax=unclassified Streptomyces TaxID=2593676 RepID=UPI00225AFC24|nr:MULTISPECIES: hypothetical protein [unclassified Streptomyces]MCX5140276.1 hypothetical protein [Streptomyces sp. NBC_00338]WRZ64862.1 hypothetical protein OG408_13645 [Streptomyces sp. NBC_01257]WSU58845.1 hypothetical protein OG450_13690 [Streptomyces sp. NBC_01104]